MLALLRFPWANVIPAFVLMLPDRRDRWIRMRLEYAFGERVGVANVPDFSDASWIAGEYAHVLSAAEGPSMLRVAAHADVAAALGHEIHRDKSPIDGIPIHCRSTDWSRLGQRLGVHLPPLDVPRVPAVCAIVVLIGLALLARKFVPREVWSAAWKVVIFVPFLVVWGAAGLFGVTPWHVRTEQQLVSHVVVERASALPPDHPWTLGEVADVVTAVTDLPPGPRPVSATEFGIIAFVLAAVGLLGVSAWTIAKHL